VWDPAAAAAKACVDNALNLADMKLETASERPEHLPIGQPRRVNQLEAQGLCIEFLALFKVADHQRLKAVAAEAAPAMGDSKGKELSPGVD
jgi:hypothetical protein